MKLVLNLVKKRLKKLRILVLFEKEPYYRDIFNQIQGFLFVLLFTIFIIVDTQKLVLQLSKNVTEKFTGTLSPPPSI